MTEWNKVNTNYHETTQHLYCNLAVYETFSGGLIYLILMENAQSLKGTQPSKKEEGSSDKRQTVMMALRVGHIRYFVKREKAFGCEH